MAYCLCGPRGAVPRQRRTDGARRLWSMGGAAKALADDPCGIARALHQPRNSRRGASVRRAALIGEPPPCIGTAQRVTRMARSRTNTLAIAPLALAAFPAPSRHAVCLEARGSLGTARGRPAARRRIVPTQGIRPSRPERFVRRRAEVGNLPHAPANRKISATGPHPGAAAVRRCRGDPRLAPRRRPVQAPVAERGDECFDRVGKMGAENGASRSWHPPRLLPTAVRTRPWCDDD